MNFRHLIVVCLAWLVVGAQPAAAAPAPEPLARIHWLGLKQVSADTNAAAFLKVWQLSSTTNLLAQTLDKLSRWPGHSATNAASARLRPLLDDLINSEFYLEVDSTPHSALRTPQFIEAPTNLQPSTFNFQLSTFNFQLSTFNFQLSTFNFQLLIRLPPARARLWQTNLPAALPTVKISQSGDWTLVSLGPNTNNPQSAIRTPQSSVVSTNWLTADLAPSALSGLRSQVSGLPFVFPQVSGFKFQVSGASGELLTRATLDFSQPLPATLPPWEIPTNLIHAPLTSFTAVRGLGPWLATLPVWKDLQFTNVPDQVFFWAQPGIPFQTYFAAPLPGASNQLSQLATRIIPKANPWLATNGEGRFQWQTNLSALVWKDALIISPFFLPASFNHREYILGGLYPPPSGDVSSPPADFSNPNLVYFQSEQTGLRVADGYYIIQLFRVVFHKPQLPIGSAATLWLQKAEPLLGDSRTSVTQDSPSRLDFTRRSTLGFTALELHLLADWLESPQFPHGLHTFLAPPDQ